MAEVFEVSGQLRWLDGQPVAEAPIFLVDEDLVSDDLIAVMRTDADGSFRARFTREAFNQDLGEREDAPALYLVVHREEEGRLISLRRVDLPPSSERVRDLGRITVPLVSGVRFRRDKVPTGWLRLKRARRIVLDPAFLQDLLQEMAEEVEPLTGWRGLARDTRLEVVEDLHADKVERMARFCERGEPDLRTRRLLRKGGSGVMANYEPLDGTIRLNRRRMEVQGLAFLRVALGHELVHVGQFSHHPELDPLYRELLVTRWGFAQMAGRIMEGQRVEPAERSAMEERLWQGTGWLYTLEGYARYIDWHFLRAKHDCPIPMTDLGLTGALFRWLTPHTSPLRPVPPELMRPLQFDVYTAGCRAYEQRHRGERPVPFDPTLRLPQTAR